MKATILNGSRRDDTYANVARRALEAELAGQGWEQQWHDLADHAIAPCGGEFGCWVQTPGICIHDDINRVIARDAAQSDLLVFFTPVTFGGYSAELKKAVDHLIQNVLPFFTVIDGTVRHQPRYTRHPGLLVIGWLPDSDPESGRIFRTLVRCNTANFHAPSMVCGILNAKQNGEAARAEVRRLLDVLQQGGETGQPFADSGAEAVSPEPLIPPPKEALLLVGSPRPLKSTSEMLGSYLLERLAAAGMRTATLHVHSCLRTEERTESLLAAVRQADLVIISFPLYVDSLPAPLMRALESIAVERSRAPASKPQLLSAIVNCGFPEADHTRTAVEISRQFALQAGFGWAGGMRLGAGQGLVHGTPLKELGGRARHLIQALEAAAQALQQGRAIPKEASLAMSRKAIPSWLYLLLGGLGWRVMAHRNKTGRTLRARPYAET